jgi:signal transduction histidine kinase
LRIVIADTGDGMPENVKNNLFKMYATFDNDKKQNKNGTGLGLMICKKLVSMLGPNDEI